MAGFVGLWYVVDEAHIVSIGVRSEYRGLGLGEMLLIAAIEQTRQMKSRVMTLEVRMSNYVAQNLYKKYGFTKRGVRRGYYTDNREDARHLDYKPTEHRRLRPQLQSLVHSVRTQVGRVRASRGLKSPHPANRGLLILI